MRKNVITIKSNSTLREAGEHMSKNRIGSLIVVEDENVIGILTEGDLVRAIGKGADPAKAMVKDFMTSPILTLTPEDTVVSALDLMRTKRIRHFPVMEGDKLVGVASARDLFNYTLADLATFFHNLIFGYYKSLVDVLKTGAPVLAPHVMRSIAEIYKREGIQISEEPTKALEQIEQLIVGTRMANEVEIRKEEKDSFVINVKDCPFAPFTHELLPTENVICPIALLAGALLSQAFKRDATISVTSLISKKGSETRITLR
jgi:predicted transcriptional regulator